MWHPSTYYPDPAIHILDPSFAKYRLPLAAIERLATGFRWAEGPVWFGDHRRLLMSDIPNDRIISWDEQTGQTHDFRRGNYANGNTRDLQGRLITCEHGGRRVTRTEYDGTITTLIDSFEGKRLNSPNDIVVKSDGSIWFTDPLFGLLSDYEGNRAPSELPAAIYRLDPASGQATILESEMPGPNGLAFSPDEKTLYVVASRAEPHRELWAYDVTEAGTLTNRRTFIDAGPGGTPDGFRVDEDGNLWCGWGMGTPELDGVMIFNAHGAPIGRISLPERCANLCFGGRRKNRLLMAASQSLYSLYVNTRGAT